MLHMVRHGIAFFALIELYVAAIMLRNARKNMVIKDAVPWFS